MPVSAPKSGCVSAAPLPRPQDEKAVIKADADERQAFADRLSLSFPVVKEEEGDVALAKRTAFHHTGQHSASAPLGVSPMCTGRLKCVTDPPPPAPITPSAKRRTVRAQPILPAAPDVERRRRSLLALRTTIGGSPSSGGEGSGVRQLRAQLGVLTRPQGKKEPTAS